MRNGERHEALLRDAMSSRSGELLDQGLDFVTGILVRLGEPDWERPSPCAGWTARDVVGHLAATMAIAVSAMQGRPRAEPGAHAYLDPLPGDVVRGPGRAFGPQAPVPAGATATERFIAWTGRELPQ
jgi:hypothetical protein